MKYEKYFFFFLVLFVLLSCPVIRSKRLRTDVPFSVSRFGAPLYGPVPRQPEDPMTTTPWPPCTPHFPSTAHDFALAGYSRSGPATPATARYSTYTRLHDGRLRPLRPICSGDRRLRLSCLARTARASVWRSWAKLVVLSASLATGRLSDRISGDSRRISSFFIHLVRKRV